jgi:hypothetical protein
MANDSNPGQAVPPLDPLERLHVYDGLMMNARRWAVHDRYHRQRQNLQHQSLHQAGIVHGLGVRLISAPESAEARFRDRRWLEIQPGLAIDSAGNPIIVDAVVDRRFRIYSTPRSGDLTVYVVVSYLNPTEPANPTVETLREWFRFDQITHPPDDTQIELCRIRLRGTVQLEEPADGLFPSFNQLDFRCRPQAQVRPCRSVRVAQLIPAGLEDSDLTDYSLHQQGLENLTALIESLPGLYPSLQGHGWQNDNPVPQIAATPAALAACDLVYLSDGQALATLSPSEQQALRAYIAQGGVLLVETPREDSLTPVLHHSQQLTSENPMPLLRWEELPRYHPLCRSPFLFGSLPTMGYQPMQWFINRGIVVIEGRLSAGWGLVGGVVLERSQIRTAQELGINLLSFAYHRRHTYQLMHWETQSDTEPGNGAQP